MNLPVSLETVRSQALERHQKTVEFLDTHSAVFTLVISGLAHFEPRLTADPMSLDISLTGDKHALETAWGVLRKAGFQPSAGERPKANDPTYNNFFNHGTGARIWLNFSSTVCRRVKIGTKIVEQDVFDTVCGEPSDEAVTPVDPAPIPEMTFATDYGSAES